MAKKKQKRLTANQVLGATSRVVRIDLAIPTTKRARKKNVIVSEKVKAAQENFKVDPKFRDQRIKKGEVRNPLGISGYTKLKAEVGEFRKLSETYKGILSKPAKLRGVDLGMTWAEAIALGQAQAAAMGSTPAAAHMCDRTEGRLPESFQFEGSIDYSAGKSAKEMLLAKLCK